MHFVFMSLALLGSSALLFATAQGAQKDEDASKDAPPSKVTGVILVKGAWSSASDTVTPVPESGQVLGSNYSNDYFGLNYTLSPEWIERYRGPPPSDSGYYVLAVIEPADRSKGSTGHLLISAQDMFFAATPARNALEQIKYSSDHLAADYKVETPPTEVRIGNHSFVRFDYVAPAAGLHWRILTTEVRCHAVQFIFTSRDPKLIDKLSGAMKTMKLPPGAAPTSGTGGGDTPVCIKDYASPEHRIAGEDPILTGQRFNPIPVRIVVDTAGKVKHIHFLSALPDQANKISVAVSQWSFEPYLVDGKPVEVETGIMFGRAQRRAAVTEGNDSNQRPLQHKPLAPLTDNGSAVNSVWR